MKLGASVTWLTNQAGAMRRMSGTVVGVVPARRLPTDHLLRRLGLAELRRHLGNVAIPRSEESYLVESQGALYWPQSRTLREVKAS